MRFSLFNSLIAFNLPHYIFEIVSCSYFAICHNFLVNQAFNICISIYCNLLLSYYLVHCSITVLKSANFTANCESQWISLSWLCWSLQIHLYPIVNMSTTSATTALAARDHIPRDIADLSYCMCLFVLPKGDGTLFNASSILEEEIIELCIWFGNRHPEGVLWYSAIKSVILFHTADKLQIMMCRVIKALTLHEEAIRVRTSTPFATHVQAYMTAVTGEPSDAQLLPSDGKEDPLYPLAIPMQVGEPHNTSRQTLGISQMMKCDSLWRSSVHRLHSESWMHPQKPTSNTLGKS